MIIVVSILAVLATNVLLPVAITIAIGVMLFFWGLKSRRESLAVSQIPEAPIANIAVGPVHVHGKTTGDDRLMSPITGVPCYFYKLQVEKWVKQGDQVTWQPYKNDTGQRSFYLDDGTARVLVDSQNADFDLPATLMAEIGINSAHYCKLDPSLGIPRLSENQLHAALISDWGQARAAVQSIGGGSAGAKAADKVLAAGEKMAEWGVSMNVDGVSLNPGLVGDSFRFRETCLLADREYSVIGTCDQNPNAKDERDRKVIHKGASATPFLISLKTGEQLVKKLQLQAMVMMTIGTVLVLAAIVFALTRR
jgi:E3 Ubiquitin ligase